MPVELDTLVLTSVPIRGGTESPPRHSAAGFIVANQDCRIVFTSKHLRKYSDTWSMEIVVDAATQCTRVLRLDALMIPNPPRVGNGTYNELDICGMALPDDCEPMVQAFDLGTEQLVGEVRRPVAHLSFEPPSQDMEYGFYGHSGFLHVGNALMALNTVYEGDLRFVGMRNLYYCFELSHAHQGHDFYRGCSGAPIMDVSGQTIAIVKGGNVPRRLIYGLPLVAVRQFVTSFQTANKRRLIPVRRAL